jgi:hypothetical protein
MLYLPRRSNRYWVEKNPFSGVRGIRTVRF